MKDALKLRKQIKNKKPDFARESSHKIKRIGDNWRKPKGLHSKMRRGRHGKPASVKPGYGSPASVRALHKSGLIPVLVHSMTDLNALKKGTHGAVVSARVGNKKRIMLLTKLKEQGIRALNIKDTDAYIKKVTDALAARKSAKTAAVKKKETKKAEKTPEKKELTEKVSEESAKEEQKKELDKVLTKRTQ